MTSDDAVLSEVIARLEYCLNPSASAAERLYRRSHLTSHDLRQCLSALKPEAVAEAVARELDQETMRLRAVICAIIEAVENRDSDAMTVAMEDARSEVVLSAIRASASSPIGEKK